MGRISYEFCDRCGNELNWPRLKLTRIKAVNLMGTPYGYYEDESELCEKCVKKFKAFMKNSKECEVVDDTIDKLRIELIQCKSKFEEIEDQYVEENEDNFELLMDLKEADDLIEEQKEKIEKLREELYHTKCDRDDLKVKGMVEKPEWKNLKVSPQLDASVLANLLTGGDIEPVEPTPPPEPEPMQAVIEETEPLPEPVFNDTAVMETTTEEVTTVEKTKKTKAPSATAFTQEQITRYSTMIRDKEPRKIILAAMMGESGINEGLANNRYYALRDKLQTQRIEDSVQAHTDSTVTIIHPEQDTKPLPRSIKAELDSMPVYATVKDFKNACCDNELLKGYSIAELKAPYKLQRQNLTW